MENDKFRDLYEDKRQNHKTLLITLAILAVSGFLLLLVKSCKTKSEEPLVENSVEATATAQDESLDQLIFRIQNCSRLYTTEYQVHKIITHEDQTVLKLGNMEMEIPFTDRHIAIPMDATLKAYIDLGTFDASCLKTDGEHILVTLPDPKVEVTSTLIDHDNTMSHVSWIRSNYSAKEQEQLHRRGLQAISENILQTDIFENAKLSATRTLVPLITRMGYKEENIRIAFSKEQFTVSDMNRFMEIAPQTIEKKKE